MADLQCLIIMSTDTTVGIAGISWVKRIPMLADLLRQTSLTQFAQLEKNVKLFASFAGYAVFYHVEFDGFGWMHEIGRVGCAPSCAHLRMQRVLYCE